MDPLTLVIFILAFGGMVIVHEFGHFIVARWSNIEVEEFGIGLPPGALTFWAAKGHLLLKDGRRVEIPANFKIPVNWNVLVGNEAKFTVDGVDDRLRMRSIEFVKYTERRKATASPIASDHIFVDQNGKMIAPQQPTPDISEEIVEVGGTTGEVEITGIIAEVHPGTRFTLNWLPLGGFVRPKGENDPDAAGGLAAASPMKRLAVLFAGPLMNLFMAFLIYSFIVSRIGAYDLNKVLVTSVVEGGPAAAAGFQAGDIFVTGNGATIENFNELSALISANEGRPVNFLVDRNGQQVSLTATPHMDAEMGRPIIGVGLSVPHRSTGSFAENLQWGARYTSANMHAMLSLPAQLIRGTIQPEQSRLVGLKGIYDIMQYSVETGIEASQTAPASQPFDWYIPTLEIIAALSISLGIFNLFPFPALDGGRIIFVLPELIIHRRVPAEFENLVHGLGMTFLLLFMIYVNVMDFINPINIP